MQITELNRLLDTHDISAKAIRPYLENGDTQTYLVDERYLLKVSASARTEQAKLDRVKTLRLAPRVYAAGTFDAAGREYHYLLMDYIQGDELWSVAQGLTDDEKHNIGKEIAQLLNELHTITDDSYDIGHYIPTVPRYRGPWREGHREYAEIMQKSLAGADFEKGSRQVISRAFGYIAANSAALQYQAGQGCCTTICIPKISLCAAADWPV